MRELEDGGADVVEGEEGEEEVVAVLLLLLLLARGAVAVGRCWT